MITACFILVTFHTGYTGYIDRNRAVAIVETAPAETKVCLAGESSCYHIKETSTYFVKSARCESNR